MVDIHDFKKSIYEGILPSGLSPFIHALWYDARGDWTAAHDLIDQLSDQRSAHVHAYLHRKEGDIWNADYWYRRAGRVRPHLSLEEEWEAMITEYLT